MMEKGRKRAVRTKVATMVEMVRDERWLLGFCGGDDGSSICVAMEMCGLLSREDIMDGKREK